MFSNYKGTKYSFEDASQINALANDATQDRGSLISTLKGFIFFTH